MTMKESVTSRMLSVLEATKELHKMWSAFMVMGYS